MFQIDELDQDTPLGMAYDQLYNKIGSLSIMELKAKRTKMDYFYFIQEFWDTIVNDPPYWNWHIPYICAEIESMVHRIHRREPKKHDLVVNLPPGTTKSLICTVFLVPWIWANYPYFRIIKVSYSDYLSLEQADLIRDIVRSQKYQDMFPNVRIKKDNSGKSNFKVTYKELDSDNYEYWRLGGSILSTSVTAKATGFHAHLKIIDDPLDPYKAHSESELRTCNTWLSQVLSNRVVDKRIVPELIIMQRVHKKDPSGIALQKAKKGKKVKHICLPGDILSEGNKKRVKPQELLKVYEAQGKYLDPVRLDKEALFEQKLNLGQFGYKSQIDQNPTSPGAGMFQVDKMNIINFDDFNEVQIQRIIRYWDKAGTQDGGTYTVGVKMAYLKNGRFLIMNVVRGQWGTSRREMVIKETVRLDGPLVPQYVEQEPGSGGKDSAYITKETLEKMGNKVFLDRPTGDKIYRADPFSVAVNLGFISMYREDWNDAFLQELEDFPNTDNKDQVDASSAAYTSLKSSKRAGSW